MLPAPSRSFRAALLGSLLLAGCGGTKSSPPPPSPTEITAGGNAYQVITPADYSTAGFKLHVPALGADERLALLVVNAGTAATNMILASSATSSAVGRLDAPPMALAATVADAGSEPLLAARAPLLRGHELARQRRESFMARGQAAGATMATPQAALQLAAAAAVNDVRSFCVYNYATNTTTLQPATLRYLSDNPNPALPGRAQFWVTDAVWPLLQQYGLGTRPDLWTVLGDAYENRILPALTTYFGQESDVDGNGQMRFLFADLGNTPDGFVTGSFSPMDVYYAADPTCNGSGSNATDMLYLLDPVHFALYWHATLPATMPPDPVTDATFIALMNEIVDGEIPSTMAHELQHNVNFNTRCLANRSRCFVAPPVCGESRYPQAENTWINEGLSMVSEDVAGYGLATPAERSRVRQYLDTYQAWSLTCWEGKPVGNYGGVHAFMRYWLDQVGTGFTRAMVTGTNYGKANVESATGTKFDAGFAQFAAASLVSNEDLARYPAGATGGTISSLGGALSAQRFNYGSFLAGGALDPTQPPWVPWHHYTGSCNNVPVERTARVNYTAFDPSSPVGSTALRADGWGAFVTRGTGADATISFTTTGGIQPSVALVRYTGALPDASFTVCQ